MDDSDYRLWLALLGETAARFNLGVHMLCLIPNHFHLLVKTPDANISAAMHHLNGKYARRFNWRHVLTGHVFQGRYHIELVEKQEHLLTLLQYIPLNPVRAGLVENADDWRWSTHLHICNLKPHPVWLGAEFVLAQFQGQTTASRIEAYRAFVNSAARLPAHSAKRTRRYVNQGERNIPPPPLEHIERILPDRNAAIVAAWMCQAYSREQIARHFAVATRTVSRIVAAHLTSQAPLPPG